MPTLEAAMVSYSENWCSIWSSGQHDQMADPLAIEQEERTKNIDQYIGEKGVQLVTTLEWKYDVDVDKFTGEKVKQIRTY